MKQIFPNLLLLKVLICTSAGLLTISASIIFGLIDVNMFNYTGDKWLSAKIVYSTGGFGFVTMVLAGMYYFQYKYRL